MIRLAIGLGISALLFTGTAATSAIVDPADRATAAALGALQRDDARIQTLGWRLATANARFCRDVQPAIGVLLQDVMNYGTPDAVRAVIGIDGNGPPSDIAVQAVAKGSPAEAAGLAPNRQVTDIDGHKMADLPVIAGDYSRLASVHRMIETALRRDGKVAITLSGQEEPLVISARPACAGSFAMRADGREAQADGRRILIGQAFGTARRPADVLEDAELAAAIAHELAHVVLGHATQLQVSGNDPQRTLRAEREADRLTVWLLANAGFDPAAGPRLMRGWGRRNDPDFHSSATHDGWEARAASMDAEIVRLRAAMRSGGVADWSREFARQ